MNINKQTQAISNDISQLAEHARALIAATAGVTEEKVGEARSRLAAALERAKEMYGYAWEKEAAGAKAVNEAMHEHLYPVVAIGIGVGVGVGALVSYLLAHRCGCRRA